MQDYYFIKYQNDSVFDLFLPEYEDEDDDEVSLSVDLGIASIIAEYFD